MGYLVHILNTFCVLGNKPCANYLFTRPSAKLRAGESKAKR